VVQGLCFDEASFVHSFIRWVCTGGISDFNFMFSLSSCLWPPGEDLLPWWRFSRIGGSVRLVRFLVGWLGSWFVLVVLVAGRRFVTSLWCMSIL